MSGARLPNAATATAADAKFRDYLLDASHPMNGGKAAFFQLFGFSRATWYVLKTALLDHPHANPVSATVQTQWGDTFEVVCRCQSPDGRNPCVKSVWVIEPISPDPKFVTAYPAPRSVGGSTVTAVS
jgi:hypothetical protein